jgi:hypothetical protein
MSNLLTPVDPLALEAVIGGAAIASRGGASASSTDPLLQQLNSLSDTIKEIGNTAKKTGFSTTEILMLGLLFNQRSSVNVFVRRPYW